MINILIVEDEMSVRILTRAKLKDVYNIFEADSGKSALDILEHHHICGY